MPAQIPLPDILSPVLDPEEKQEVPRTRSPMERLAARLDLSVFDLWIIIFTVMALALLYGIGEIAAR
ncbi:MAG: hypothetical protein QME13_08250, partial [Thermoanaerobacteraceae bacterium]|nr:hypothetical protein [Thermoanaerobacteraceae bacterium]